jgi:mycofactocin system glycosyltransferase
MTVGDATSGTRYRLDRGLQRFGRAIVGGSPLKLFRVTDAGAAVVDRIAAGEAVAPSALVTALAEAGAIHPEPDRSPFGPHDVTIVVPTYGVPRRVPPGAVLVDDGSPVPVAGATVRLEHNRGPGAARNAGLAQVTTPLVAFVDTDVELPAGWLEPLLLHFADPRVALVAPRVTTTAVPSPVAWYERSNSPLDLGSEPARIRAGTRVSYVPAAAIVCRVDALREIGGFDESLRFGEDVDLVWRLDETGWRCRYEPAAEVGHDPRSSWGAWARQRITYGASTAPLARRHPGALAPIRMSGWSVATWALAAVERPIAGSLVGLGSAAALIRKLPDVPPRAAFGLAARGNLQAGDQIAKAVRRAWWPIIAVAALRSRTARRILLAAALAARHPVRLADDLAYSVGVWSGIVAERTLAPLVPEISSWPGRRAAAQAVNGARDTADCDRYDHSP